VLAPALEAVIANHPEGGAPVVPEGDFLLPALAVQPTYGDTAADGQVRAIFLYEEDEAQFCRNFVEGEEQPERAHAAVRHSRWLR
jgi:hypothetical protein